MRLIITFAAVLNLAPVGNRASAGQDSQVRVDAGKKLHPKLVAELAAALSSNDYKQQTETLAALAKLFAEKKGALADFNPLIAPLFKLAGWGGIARQNARVAEDLIVRIGAPALPLLKEHLLSADAHDRRVAAELLVRIGPPDATLAALLRPLLTDRDSYVRRAAIEGIAAVGPPAKKTIDDLEWLALNDPDLSRRAAARIALIHVAGASEERIRELADFLELQEPCDFANVIAASALGKLGPKARTAEARLLAALKHTDGAVRGSAAAALPQIGAQSPEVVTALINLLKADLQREVRRSAAGSLGEMGSKARAAVPALAAALKGDGQIGWWVAADALGKIGGAEVVPILVTAVANSDDGIRHASIQALGNLGAVAKPAVMALEKSRRQDARAYIRAAATEALRKIEQAVQKMN